MESRLGQSGETAAHMLRLAKLCSRCGDYHSAVELLRMSLACEPLAKRNERYADRAQRAAYVVGSQRDEQGEKLYPNGVDMWRLEACMLAEGMQRPWPATLVKLISEASAETRTATVEAFAGICRMRSQVAKKYSASARGGAADPTDVLVLHGRGRTSKWAAQLVQSAVCPV